MAFEQSEDDEANWCTEQRANVMEYLQREGFSDPNVGEWPAWHVLPVISVWAVESLEKPDWVGWWVVSGDFPTDYTTCQGERHPRQALRDIGMRWQTATRKWAEGTVEEGWKLTPIGQESNLAPLLASRAEMFLRLADDNSVWEDI